MPPHITGPVWLQGPIEGIPDLLQPVAHALVEAAQDVRTLLGTITPQETWTRPHGAAPVGFHVRHAVGSLDRLLTYARGEELGEAQLAALAAEKTMDSGAGEPAMLSAEFDAAIDRALEQLRSTSPDSLMAPRLVGRAKLPSTVLGLLAHAADHTYRHVGQAVTTTKIVRGMLAHRVGISSADDIASH